MPKVPEQSIVDIDIRKRMEEGFTTVTGEDMTGDDVQYNLLMRLCRIMKMDPLTHTYEEINTAIKKKFLVQADLETRLLGGGRP